MKQEIKSCQNCKIEFTVEPEDFVFYEKIKVPPPTWCPECRMVRRMVFVNERLLFRRNDDFHQKPIVSIYPDLVPFPVYDQSTWWSDKWDPMEYGQDYDFSRPFFEQFKKLSDKVPRYNVTAVNSPGCDYCTKVIDSKNSYLTVGLGAEDCLYGNYTRISKGCVDYFFLDYCEFCYESVHCYHCQHVLFSEYAFECRNSAFLYDCTNCSNCFGCVGLRNKEYHIFNKPYRPEEYKRAIQTLSLSGFQNVNSIKKRFSEMKLAYPKRYAQLVNSVDTTGNDVVNGKNCRACFDIDASEGSVENSKYVFIGTSLKDGYDIFETGENGELVYEGVLAFGYHLTFSAFLPGGSHHIAYSDTCFDSSYLFGCIGLRKKQYCILNKQYTKDEYEKLVPRIIQHMNDMPYLDKQERKYPYGEFFPAELSPFAYNESIAQEYFPLTKEEVVQKGYTWKAAETRIHQITMPAESLPDNIKDVQDSVLNETIGCMHGGNCNEQCTGAFKIIGQELEFYRNMGLPLPRMCPNCRHYQRVRQRNPIKLWKRMCQCAGVGSENGVYTNQAGHVHNADYCGNSFETSYAPDRPEIVYCEQCYQAEVT